MRFLGDDETGDAVVRRITLIDALPHVEALPHLKILPSSSDAFPPDHVPQIKTLPRSESATGYAVAIHSFRHRVGIAWTLFEVLQKSRGRTIMRDADSSRRSYGNECAEVLQPTRQSAGCERRERDAHFE